MYWRNDERRALLSVMAFISQKLLRKELKSHQTEHCRVPWSRHVFIPLDLNDLPGNVVGAIGSLPRKWELINVLNTPLLVYGRILDWFRSGIYALPFQRGNLNLMTIIELLLVWAYNLRFCSNRYPSSYMGFLIYFFFAQEYWFLLIGIQHKISTPHGELTPMVPWRKK